jgi:hypothetical protein
MAWWQYLAVLKPLPRQANLPGLSLACSESWRDNRVMYAKFPDHDDEVRKERLYAQLEELGFKRGRCSEGRQRYDTFTKDRKEIRIKAGLRNPLTDEEIALILEHANGV